MTSAVGFPTLRLVRIRIGQLHIGTLQPSQVQSISFSEIDQYILKR